PPHHDDDPNPNPQLDEPNVPVVVQQPRSIVYNCRCPPELDLEQLLATSTLPKLQETMEYILLIKNASLDDLIAKMTPETLMRIWNPPQRLIVIESAGA
ncbi:hypothetical protein L210DRAFT_868671, partial [Boletus edulis BED1]